MSLQAVEARTQTADTTTIRPFTVNVPEAELTELRRRVKTTQLPEKDRSRTIRRECHSR